MSREYPTLTSLTSAWLARVQRGARLEEHCARDNDHACLWFRGGWNDFKAPFAFRLRYGSAEVVLMDAEHAGGADYSSRSNHVARMASEAGVRVLWVSFAMLTRFSGETDIGALARAAELAAGRISEVEHRQTEMEDGRRRETMGPTRTFSSRRVTLLEIDGSNLLTDIDGRRVLFGVDDLSGRRFATQVAADAITIAQAIAHFRPAAIAEAEANGLPFFRQGNWWFVRHAASFDRDMKRRFQKNFTLPEPGHASHVTTLGFQDDHQIWVSGKLTHSPVGHGRIGRLLQLDGLWSAHTACSTERAV